MMAHLRGLTLALLATAGFFHAAAATCQAQAAARPAHAFSDRRGTPCGCPENGEINKGAGGDKPRPYERNGASWLSLAASDAARPVAPAHDAVEASGPAAAEKPVSPARDAVEASGPAGGPEAPKPPDAPKTTPSAPPRPAEQTPAKPPSPKGKLLRTQWFLLTYESHKIGYENKALYQTDGLEPSAYRLEIHRFLKTSPADAKPACLENISLEMDKEWTAVAFKTTRRGLGVKAAEVQGRVADGKLQLVITGGAERQECTIPLEGRPTFNGAFIDWLGSQPLAIDQTFSRCAIDERDGTFSAAPRTARVVQRVPVTLAQRSEDAFLVRDQSGFLLTAHLLHPSGLLLRSEGQNHNLVVQEMAAEQVPQLDLSGNVEWQNRVEGQAGDAFSCEAYGYRAALPAYPYVPLAAGDGRFLAFNNLMGNDGLLVIATAIAADDQDAPRRLYQQWTALVGQASDVVESRATVADLPALVFEGQIMVGGLPARFSAATVAREHVGYVIAYLRLPPAPADDTVFRNFLAGLAWTKILGRERSHWEGQDYVSESYGYRLRLLGAGWRLPQERSGVATSIEAARDDHSALVAVLIEPAAATTLDEAVVAYEKQIKERLPRAADLKHQEARLGGRTAIMVSYQFTAIDNEPTESRHVLTLDAGRLVVLTFVGKKSALEANLKHFAAVMESFKFTPPAPSGEPPK